MIKEVEIRNTVQSVKVGSLYPPYTTDPEVPMLTGFVQNDGQELTVDVNREIKQGFARIVYVFFAAVDQEYRRVNYHLIETSDPITTDSTETSHTFDISSVLTIPRSTPRIFDYTQITIDLFTYEANITDNTGTAIYGQKQLSVPYRAEMGANDMFPVSTDGWYPIGLVDYKREDVASPSIAASYVKNDLVYWYDTNEAIQEGVYKALTNTANTPTLDDTSDWVLATTEDIMTFFTIPLPPSITSAVTIVGANAIISRYVKKKYLSDLLTRISYKPFDDSKALFVLIQIASLREDCILKLEEGSLPLSVWLLDMCGYQYKAIFDPDHQVTLTQINSSYTI